MCNSCLSNPPRTSERSGLRLAPLVAAALLAATGAAAQPLRQVVVELRIEPGSTLRHLRTPEVAAAVEKELARIAKEKFLYLDWVPSAEAAAPAAPRWVLQVADGPRGACDPPAVRASFRAERGGVVAWSYPDLELTGVCDIAASEMTINEFTAKVSALATGVAADPQAMRDLEARFLSEIVVAKSLTPDPAAQKLYLPLKGLKAKAESEIEVRFKNRLDSRLLAHPGDIEGERTQLLLVQFACAGINSGAPAASALPIAWHPRLPELLAACPDPFVYMKLYKPNPLEVVRGVVTTLGDGGMP